MLSRDHLSSSHQKHAQDLERLLLDLDPDPVLPKFSGLQVGFVRTETNEPRLGGRSGHAPAQYNSRDFIGLADEAESRLKLEEKDPRWIAEVHRSLHNPPESQEEPC